LREAANALASGTGQAWLDGIAALSPYSEDDDGERAPAAVERLRRTIAVADAVLIATPEYNGSIPGGLKNALDWTLRPFPDNAWRDKPVAVIGASTGIFGAVRAQAELRKSLRSAGASVIDAELAVGGAHDAFLLSGALRDPDLAAGLRDVVAALVEAQPGREPELAGRAAPCGVVAVDGESPPRPRSPEWRAAARNVRRMGRGPCDRPSKIDSVATRTLTSGQRRNHNVNRPDNNQQSDDDTPL
jgi:chromate reductase, NAD(P)H dehydrogenase (quinone)